MLAIDIIGLCEKWQIPQNSDKTGKFEGFEDRRILQF